MLDIRKLAIPFAFIWPIFGVAAGAAGSYAATSEKIRNLEERAAVSERKAEKAEEHHNEDHTQIAEVKNSLGFVLKALDRIEDKMGTKR